LTASLLLAMRECKWRLLPRLPLTFSILHLAYGFGFLKGLIKFRNRWTDRNTHAKWNTQTIETLKAETIK
ncbi:MAG TPA: hypothetical protein VEF04_02145, partial [Blastocatellia bacterium]|nr:hypothetical protein [Blastocatellia bacterium]